MQQNTKLELDEYKHFGELFIEADRLSNKNQKFYLSFRFTQMLLLTLSTLIAIYSHGFTPIIFIICVLFSLILHLIIRIYNFDKSWYLYRSLAESIKSASWQFIMKGEKFRPTTNTQEATLLYKRFLHSLVSEINSSQSGPGQFTDISGLNISPTQRMIDIRESDLNERIEIYKNKRIANQKEWYKVKSLINRKKEIKYFLLSIFSFFLFCIFVALDLYNANWFKDFGTPYGSFFISLGFSFMTWAQINNFSTLAESYNFTAIEIEKLEIEFGQFQSSDSKDDKEFSEIIQNSESAFSREHTSWLARQQQSQGNLL